jgi:hypothetical protein
MAVGYGKPIPKPEKRATSKGRAKRHEAAIIQQVRAACVARDGDCRLGPIWDYFGSVCGGESEWAHMPTHRRSKTIGQPAEDRHCTEGSLMLCTRHHAMLDQHHFDIIPIDSALGANGVLRIVQGPVSVLSVPRT